jgi:hypothetical protein
MHDSVHARSIRAHSSEAFIKDGIGDNLGPEPFPVAPDVTKVTNLLALLPPDLGHQHDAYTAQPVYQGSKPSITTNIKRESLISLQIT